MNIRNIFVTDTNNLKICDLTPWFFESNSKIRATWLLVESIQIIQRILNATISFSERINDKILNKITFPKNSGDQSPLKYSERVFQSMNESEHVKLINDYFKNVTHTFNEKLKKDV